MAGAPAARARAADRPVGIRIIVAYKAIKAVAEVVGAIVLVVLALHGDLSDVRHYAAHLERDIASRWAVLLGHALGALVSHRGLHLVELGLALDGVLSAFEGWSLWRGYRWGPWLVVVATATPLPLEVLHVVRTGRISRALVVVVNALVVAYLARRIVVRRRHADAPAPPPPAAE